LPRTNYATLISFQPTTNPIASVKEDGIYEIEVLITVANNAQFSAVVHIEFLGPHGYISAIDWPFLPVNNE